MQDPQQPHVPLIPEPSEDNNQQQFPTPYPQQLYSNQEQFNIQQTPIQQQPVIGQQVLFVNAQEQISKLNSSMNPTEFYCFNCNTFQTTVIHNEPGAGTHLMALLLCCIGGLLICCKRIPYIISSCQDVIHRCPTCRQEVGRRNFLNM